MARSIANATKWALLGQFFKLSFRLVVNLVLARLLEPKEFGLVGMVTVIITLLSSLGELGLFASIVQKKDISQKDLSSVFWLNVILGFVISILLYLAAPLIVSFYNEPALLNVVRVMSVNFIFSSLVITQNAILTKALSFKRIETYSLVSVTLSSVLSLWLAYKGFGVWALVFGQNANFLANALLVWVFEKWRPSFIISKHSLKQMLGFGMRMVSSSVLNTFLGSIDLLIIGRYFMASTLGFYSYAQNLINIPVITFSSAFARVLFPVMSLNQDDNMVLKQTYKKVLNLVNSLILPAMGAVVVLAGPIVTTLINPEWSEMIPYVRLLAVIAVLYPISAINVNILMAKGYANKFLKLEIAKKALFVGGIVAGIAWGIMGILFSMLITSVAGVALNLYICGKVSDYSIREQVKDLRPVLLISLVFIGALYVVFKLFCMVMPDIFAALVALALTVPFLVLLYFKYQPELVQYIRQALQTQLNLK